MAGDSRLRSSSQSKLPPKNNTIQNCGKCKKEVQNVGTNAVICQICSVWFHYPCVGINDKDTSLLQNQQIYWFCSECNPAASTIIEQIYHLKTAQEMLKSTIEAAKTDMIQTAKDYVDVEIESLKESLKTRISNNITKAKSDMNADIDNKLTAEIAKSKLVTSTELETKVTTAVENKVETIKTEVSKSYAQATSTNLKLDDVKKAITDEVNSQAIHFKTEVETYKKDVIEKEFPTLLNKGVWEEANERDRIKKRECNLIVHNLPETQEKDDDLKNMCAIFKDVLFVNDVNISNLTRLGEKKDRDRLLRITVQDTATKKRILSRATELRNLPDEDYFSRVYLRPDLTPKQQEASKNLYATLLEVREQDPTNHYKISKGSIVKVGPKENI